MKGSEGSKDSILNSKGQSPGQRQSQSQSQSRIQVQGQTQLSAMILAGGQSRRMGRDKALLVGAQGESLLQKTAQVAAQLTAEVWVVTPWPERYQPAVSVPVRWLKEQQPAAGKTGADGEPGGPLRGFAQGWGAIATDWCLLLACDMPRLDAAVLAQWWAWLQSVPDQRNDRQAEISQPVASLAWGDKHGQPVWEPLCGYYHRCCVPSLKRYLRDSSHRPSHAHKNDDKGRKKVRKPSFQGWLSQTSVLAYDQAPPQMFFNCNTPAEWAEVATL